MEYLKINEENYYKITNSDRMRPFFMSIVSDSNHWLFMSSNGGVTAGRKNSSFALFPYYTEDKVTESYETTGSKSIFLVTVDNVQRIWEPFSDKYLGVYKYTRNLYKNEYGNKVIFEEINHDLGLRYQCHWNSSNEFGFVKKSRLVNESDEKLTVQVLDGLQNLMPFGVDPNLQQASSNLVDAYKKSELLPESGLGIYALSAIIVDKAEPSEALKANMVWSKGLDNPTYLVSSLQLDDFRLGGTVIQEVDIRAEKGAYFVVSKVQLNAGEEKEWIVVGDVNKGTSAIINISERLQNEKDIVERVFADIELGTQNLLALTASADAIQLTADKRRNTRHYANVLFNIMRGGIFDANYSIDKEDFIHYLAKANQSIYEKNYEVLKNLPDTFEHSDLKTVAWKSEDKDFIRLSFEYLPLKFSRRHGDPSRPWNKFSINTVSEEGEKVLDYEGNWRDIFQNWEALVHSYPSFIDSMIFKFLNATTFDGYNPYRVTKGGFDWETIEPDDPWSYIGYWGDHQIIYLLKFLEFSEKHHPGSLSSYLDKKIFVYANVPYKIKNYQAILKNPKDTIVFDEHLDAEIREKRSQLGADGALLNNPDASIYSVNLLEKLLATMLAKVSNLILEGGIWMNTQRPEWNDANNALVGNGVSMVTLYYLRRFFIFFDELIKKSSSEELPVSEELKVFFETTLILLQENLSCLSQSVTDVDRKRLMDGLGRAASSYRTKIYEHGFSAKKQDISKNELLNFSEMALTFLDHSIKKNKREDSLYHAYNLMTVENEQEVSIAYLPEMLEGQVGVLSSGFLSGNDALELLDALKRSKLYREDQYSYLLYPNRDLARFTEKNNIPSGRIQESKLVNKLLKDGNASIVEKDVNGDYHFNGSFNNADSLKSSLAKLPKDQYGALIEEDSELLLSIFESIFDHKSFTGRSGTFFGYEGLGSIYWHMVSKLLLAVQETCLKAVKEKESDEIIGRLFEHYHEINEGIGVHKTPDLYGAFPTDPYSHTPAGKGAQQPGMTGQVKEDILSRFGELGVFVNNGQIQFNPVLLRKEEFLKIPTVFEYVDLNEKHFKIDLDKGSLGFTYCQIPVIYEFSDSEHIKVVFKDSSEIEFGDLALDGETSRKIFERTGEVEIVRVYLKNKV